MAAKRRPQLRRLAERLGILAAYVDAGGRRRETADGTRVALAAAMGCEAASEAEAAGALRALAEQRAHEVLEPVWVGPAGDRRVPVRRPPGCDGPLEWRLRLHTEEGAVFRAEGRAAAGVVPRLRLPRAAPPGYHELELRLETSRARVEARQRRIHAPPAGTRVEEKLGHPGFGLWTNLYTLRSARGQGVGDLSDLRRVARLAGRAGAAFVGINPLHALRNRGTGVSPYSPVSRLYRSFLYLDVEAVPELRSCREARARLASPGFRRRLARLRAADDVDYAGVARAKREVLRLLHRRFAERGAGSPRGRAYARYLEREGDALRDFASFSALAEHLEREGRGADWRRWPAAYRDPRSQEVERFRARRRREVDFQCWLQFELDRQLAGAAGAAARAGLGVGLYSDLAVGSAPTGSDTWAFRELFATGASVGAPPDDYSDAGQDWGFPPLDPHVLRRDGYAYWVRLLRAAFAHAGALRIDHVMGLLRLFWIPSGRSAGEGAYVRYPAAELLGILALESRRHGAIVIGEDLGTVPRGLQAALAGRGILSSRVLLFERDRRGRFRPAAGYSRRALATVGTHDLPPLAGWLRGRDLELRRRVGHLPDDDALAAAQAARASERDALARRLRDAGAPRGREPTEAELCAAATRFLCRTPAPLVGLSLDDLTGEVEPVNLPGVPQEQHPSWTRRMSVAVEDLAAQPTFRSSLGAVPRTRRARASRRGRAGSSGS